MLHALLLPRFLLLLLLLPSIAYQLCSSDAVADLKSVLLSLNGGTPWRGANGTSDPCNWPGIRCDSASQVTSISLSGFDLAGSIPDSISALQPSLLLLDLSNNSLKGIIPDGLMRLSKLQSLDLSENELEGSIPVSIGNLTEVMHLSFARNRLSGAIPDTISELSKLQSFSAYENTLNGSIPAMASSKLTLLNLASNNLTGGIPGKLCASGNFSVLVLTANQLSGPIPEDLASCSSLTTLRIGENLLSGGIHRGFGTIPNLIYLEADHNRLSGVLPSEIAWKSLSLFNLAFNSLNGSIPDALSRTTSLQELLLSGNSFSGPIPGTLTQLSNLTVLDLSANQLSHTIPDDICKIPRLQYLQLGGNLLSGAIPSTIGNCSNLIELQLGSNQLSGSIPPEIGSLSNLQVLLDLSSNQLTGSIPPQLENLVKLVSLNLSRNLLSGQIPPDLESMVSLLDVDFSYNNLSGTIPNLKNSNASSFLGNPGLCGPPLTACTDALNVSGPKARKNLPGWKIAGIVLGSAALLLVVLTLVVFACLRNRFLPPDDDPASPLQPVATCSQVFTESLEKSVDFESVKAAVGNSSNVVSRNHFSTVYKAVMPSGLALTAKKLKSAEKGIVIHRRKTILELEKVARSPHENIMKPIGYYIENELAVIIYEFVPLYSLEQRLHRASESVLSWPNRYAIALKVAQGLAFLHHTFEPPITHVDISSSNVFLGSNLEVKIGDVEVGKLLDPSKHTGSISAVAGTIGYIPPEYAFTMRVTLASNVYSFGVILLELLTGRRPIEESFGDCLDLARWVHETSSRGKMLEQILDTRVSARSLDSQQEMVRVLKIALLCTHSSPSKRPRMKKVLRMLQDAGDTTYM